MTARTGEPIVPCKSVSPRLARRSLLAAVAAALALPAVGQVASWPTLRPLSPQERGIADGLAPVPLVDMNLRPAAAVRVWAEGRGSPQQAVQRANLGVNAAVYAGAPFGSAPLLPLPPGARQPRELDFQTEGDSVEGWATMTDRGVPHLRLNGFGQFGADATAAWTSRFTLGGSTSKEVVLRFVVPPTVVGGATEEDAPAWWRARLRTDLLVNGFPAWSTDALRLRADYIRHNPSGVDSTEPLLVLQTFGEPMPFGTNDEDTPPLQGGPANDSNGGNVDTPSSGKLVYLSQGRFSPGQAIELMMIVRGSAGSWNGTGASGDNRCKTNPATGGWFCSRATMVVDGRQADAPRLILLP